MDTGGGRFSGPTGLESHRAATRWVVEAFGWTCLLGGSLVLGAATRLADELEDEEAAGALVATGLVTAVATTSVVGGTYVVVASATSPRRRVFRARGLAVVACCLSIGLVASVAGLFVDPPFQHVYRSVHLGASDLVDLGRLLAAATWFVGTSVTLSELRTSRRDERRWTAVPTSGH